MSSWVQTGSFFTLRKLWLSSFPVHTSSSQTQCTHVMLAQWAERLSVTSWFKLSTWCSLLPFPSSCWAASLHEHRCHVHP